MSLPQDLYKDFPLVAKQVAQGYVYLDNAATTHKPQVVLDAMMHFYTHEYGTVHRSVYAMGEQATTLYEQARATVAHAIGAAADEIIFTKNATEGINIAAYAWALQHLKSGDEILLTEYEHHANLLPWQRIAQLSGATLRFIPVLPDGTLDLSVLSQLVTQATKLIAVAAVSNVTGAYTDLTTIKQVAQQVQAKLLIDAAQMVAHAPVDITTLGADFLVFSGHKVYGPTGIGVLYCKPDLMDQMQPFFVGGGTIFSATYHEATYLKGPQAFEAGTPAIAQAIGLAAALTYVQQFSMYEIQQHEATLTAALLDGLSGLPQLHVVGPQQQLRKHGHLVTFYSDLYHAHDIAAYASEHGIAVRAGHHCAQPLAHRLYLDATVRASFALYNRMADVEKLLEVLQKLVKHQ